MTACANATPPSMLMALTPGRWCDSRLTEALASGERFPVFCYGSNGIEQMRDRCRNGGLTSCRARLPDASRVFGGWSERWAGAVASVQPLAGHEVRGSVVDLDSAEIELLDSFEATNPDAPYVRTGAVYHRQDVVVLVQREAGGPEVAAVALVYVKVDASWRGPPSQRYVDACVRNVLQFWDGSEVEVRDERGNLRDGPGGGGGSGGGGSSSSSSSSGGASSLAPLASPPAGSAPGGEGKGKGKRVALGGGGDAVTHFDADASQTVRALAEAWEPSGNLLGAL